MPRRIVESRLYRHLGRTVRGNGWQDMNSVERDRGQLNQIHVPVEASIEAKITQIGGDPIEIRGVVADDRNRYAGLFFGESHWLDGIGNVE